MSGKPDRHPCAGRGPSTLCDSDSTSAECQPSPDLYGPWALSAVAFEHFDSGRTHTFGCATFTGSMTGGGLVTPVEGGHFRYLGLAGEIYDLRVKPGANP